MRSNIFKILASTLTIAVFIQDTYFINLLLSIFTDICFLSLPILLLLAVIFLLIGIIKRENNIDKILKNICLIIFSLFVYLSLSNANTEFYIARKFLIYKLLIIITISPIIFFLIFYKKFFPKLFIILIIILLVFLYFLKLNGVI